MSLPSNFIPFAREIQNVLNPASGLIVVMGPKTLLKLLIKAPTVASIYGLLYFIIQLNLEGGITEVDLPPGGVRVAVCPPPGVLNPIF